MTAPAIWRLFRRFSRDQLAPIVRVGAGGERELVLARLGMPGPPQFGGAPTTSIRNFWGPHWRGRLVPRNLCLAPSTNFCEYEDKDLPDEQNHTRLARVSEFGSLRLSGSDCGHDSRRGRWTLIGGPVGAVVGGAAGAATAPGAPLGGQYRYRCYSYDYNGNRHYHRCRVGETASWRRLYSSVQLTARRWPAAGVTPKIQEN